MSQIAKITKDVHFKEAICTPKWVKEMNEELEALEENETWEITSLPP